MFSMNETLKQKVEELGWTVKEDRFTWSFQQHSPAGEDLYEECNKDEDILDWALNLADNFDADEHVEMWVEAKHSGVSGVPSIRELVEDADEIQKMFNELCDVIREYSTDVEDEEDTEED